MERTKEIGIRKALGAQNKDIERQFLSETVFICLIGGLLGVLLGLILGFVGAEVGSSVIQSRMPEMEELSHVTVHPSMPAILVSVGFSMLTGLVFGLYPARRAARMSPIDALRYESCDTGTVLLSHALPGFAHPATGQLFCRFSLLLYFLGIRTTIKLQLERYLFKSPAKGVTVRKE